MQVLLLSHRASVTARWHDALSALNPVATSVSMLQTQSRSEPAVLFVHISSISANECELLVKLAQQSSTLSLVACDDVPSTEQGIALLQSGFKGYTNTFMAPMIQQEIIKSVSNDEIWASPEVLQKLIQKLLHRQPVLNNHETSDDDRLSSLSQREHEVVAELGKGLSNKEIARKLAITERTVKAHLSSIFQKTGMPDRVSLVLLLSGKL